MIINNSHALYYNGELVGIITNPDPIGDMLEICDRLDVDGDQLAGAMPIIWPVAMDRDAFVLTLKRLGVAETIDMPSDEED